MSKISAMIDVGRRSLMNSQTALQTVSHNIANKSTEGYSRQRVDLQANVPIGSSRVRVGMGARASSVTRINNPFIEKQILNEGAELGFMNARSESLGRVEQVYNEQLNPGLNKYISDFFNAFRELSTSPENLASRTLVRETAQNLVTDFSRVSGQLKGIQNEINAQLKNNVEQINQYATEVADLNHKIQVVELAGNAVANDERDRRDLILKKMSELINIKWAEGDDGMVAISAGPSPIVSGHFAMKLDAREVPSERHRGGVHMEIFYQQKDDLTPMKITDQVKGGSIGGLLDVRDGVIEDLLADVDEMAFRFASAVNTVHAQGFDRYDQPGVGFFEVGPELDAAETLSLSEDIRTDVAKIATAAQVGSPGDNRVSNMIVNLQNQKFLGGGQSTMDEFYNGIVGKVGVTANRALSGAESQQNVVTQLKNIRESISGVSLDEETTKMIDFQKTFDASARLIRTADEMLDTVLSLKR